MGAICALLELLSWAGGDPCWAQDRGAGAASRGVCITGSVLCAVLSGQPVSAPCLCTQHGEHT